MRTLARLVVLGMVAGVLTPAAPTAAAEHGGSALEEAQRLFYSGDYDRAAALALAVRVGDSGNLAASEIRTSALHFQLKRALGAGDDKDRAWKTCEACPALLAEFLTELNLGRTQARARLQQNPADIEALFFLGKLNLNYVWMQLGTIGRRTGWSEYWEARRSLDAALQADPEHVRARVARAFIDYIVDTRVPRGVRWVLGGGNKKRGLQIVRDASLSDSSPPYVQAEAMFALWDMQVRERHVADAVLTARALARDFPANRELAKFLSTYDLQGRR